MYQLVFLLSLLVASVSAFAPVTSWQSAVEVRTALQLGFLDNILGENTGKPDTRVAEASHILLTGPNASAECEQLKVQIYKDALGWFGKPENGVEPEKLIKAFGNKARAQSTCPSAKQGGSLGYFPRGQMVKEFDDVAFGAQVGIVHGPVETEFGSHLILITDRTEE